ncbi:hypothetical protein [Methyloversatilis sp. RAC08]|uniref:hypothetical protein n=1 Tax=Methyloversatilis sp. RAC08 TaxID=1842540 RepID=UPI0012373C6E|nr:hypothetical protein [Methyloversatilis sp. RAC08]
MKRLARALSLAEFFAHDLRAKYLTRRAWPSAERVTTDRSASALAQARAFKARRKVSGEALVNLCRGHMLLREYAEAREAFEEAIKIKRLEMSAWVALSDIFRLAGSPTRRGRLKNRSKPQASTSESHCALKK